MRTDLPKRMVGISPLAMARRTVLLRDLEGHRVPRRDGVGDGGWFMFDVPSLGRRGASTTYMCIGFETTARQRNTHLRLDSGLLV